MAVGAVNRDELLSVCLKLTDSRPGDKIIEAHIEGDVIAHADVYWRRVVVSPPTGRGEGASVSGDTLFVAAAGNFCVDPDYRRDGWGTALLQGVRDEAEAHALVGFVAVFGCLDFFGGAGFFHPDGATDERFLVQEIRGEPWPAGTIDMRGEW